MIENLLFPSIVSVDLLNGIDTQRNCLPMPIRNLKYASPTGQRLGINCEKPNSIDSLFAKMMMFCFQSFREKEEEKLI